jgi:hypothetical protein
MSRKSAGRGIYNYSSSQPLSSARAGSSRHRAGQGRHEAQWCVELVELAVLTGLV